VADLVMAEFLTLRPVAPLWLCALALAALGAALILAERRWPAPVSGRRRAALSALRIAAAVCAALLFLRPVVAWQGREPARAEVAFLLDASRSLEIRDAAGPGGEAVTRAQAVRDAFAGASAAYRAFADKYAIRVFAFGSRLRPVDTFAPPPADPRTDLGEGLDGLSGPGPKFAAVVLISDGRANRGRDAAPEDAARQLAEAGTRVHAVGVGSPDPTDRVRDAAVRDLRAPLRVFAGNRPAIRAVASALGLKGRPLALVLEVNGKEVERREVTPASNLETHEVVFTPTLAEPGLARVALGVRPVAGELTEANNRAETCIRVDQGGVRVLYLEGRLRPEMKYIARALGRASEIELQRRILAGPGAAEVAPKPGDLDAFDVFILGDLPAGAMATETLERLAERVRSDGAGLLALGGFDSAAGGWAATPLADVLPFAVHPGQAPVKGPIRFVPTADGRRHFILDIASQGESGDAFASLPPLSGASAVGPPAPTARVLARSEDGAPILGVREFAKGRSAALTVDTTWQWVFAPDDPNGPEHHARFWRQLVLWLAGRDGRPKEDLWVGTDRPRYLLADPDRPPQVEVRVGTRGAAAPPKVMLTGPRGEAEAVALEAAGPGDWRAVLKPAAPGSYKLAAEAEVGGARKGAEATFAVEEQDLELATVLADHDALRRIAEAGGGTFRPVGELTRLLEELESASQPAWQPVERRVALAANRVFLVVFLGLLAAEWVLRRRWGLV
jgi:uncharacterized membrane protein